MHAPDRVGRSGAKGTGDDSVGRSLGCDRLLALFLGGSFFLPCGQSGGKWIEMDPSWEKMGYGVAQRPRSAMLRVHCQSNATVDQKGRLALPRPLRNAMDTASVDRLVVTFSGESLWAFTPDDFYTRIEEPLEAGDVWDEDVQEWVHAVLAPAQDVSVDKAGRILLPPMLRELAGIEREITVNSVQRRIEIWDREAWQAHFANVMKNRPKRSRGLPKRPGSQAIPFPERR